MPITVKMIEDRDFGRSLQGYDPREVDEFLDDICDEMITLQDTIDQLRKRIFDQEEAAEQARQKNPQQSAAAMFPPVVPISSAAVPSVFPHDLTAAKRLLEETQIACDTVLAEAKQEAERIVAEAKANAAKLHDTAPFFPAPQTET